MIDSVPDASASVPDFTATAGKVAGSPLFVIDYPQLLHSTAPRAENHQQEIAYISSGINALAKELEVPVTVLSQLNRELEREKDRKPRMSDLRDSGSIEQDADLVGLLYKPGANGDGEGVTGNAVAEEAARSICSLPHSAMVRPVTLI